MAVNNIFKVNLSKKITHFVTVTYLCTVIDTLISSKTRIKLLLKFFLNSGMKAYLRSLEQEFGESSNAIRIELNRLEEAGMLSSATQGNRKYYHANTQHPLYNELHSILIKHVGIDKILEHLVGRLGDLQAVYLVGSFAKGLDSGVIDLVMVGQIDTAVLSNLVAKAENMISRRIRFVVFENLGLIRWSDFSDGCQPMLLWAIDKNTGA